MQVWFYDKILYMKKVLITGGSEGLGLALAECYAKDGYHIVLCARNRLKLEEAKHILQNIHLCKVDTISLDLSVIGNSQKLYETVGSVDVLINNAGIGSNGISWKIPMEKEEQLVQINVIAMMDLCKLYLKDMAERKEGVILNIASTGAFQPGPYIASYYASKSFVESYSQAIAMEAREYGISVYCACPGPLDTDFYHKHDGKKPKNVMSAEHCASYIYSHMHKKVVIIPGLLNRIVYYLPKKIKMRFVYRMKKKALKEKKDAADR